MTDKSDAGFAYTQVFQQARKHSMHIKCMSQHEAKRLRMRLYQHRKKLLAEGTADAELLLILPIAHMSVFGKTLTVSYPTPEEHQNANRRISLDDADTSENPGDAADS